MWYFHRKPAGHSDEPRLMERFAHRIKFNEFVTTRVRCWGIFHFKKNNVPILLLNVYIFICYTFLHLHPQSSHLVYYLSFLYTYIMCIPIHLMEYLRRNSFFSQNFLWTTAQHIRWKKMKEKNNTKSQRNFLDDCVVESSRWWWWWYGGTRMGAHRKEIALRDVKKKKAKIQQNIQWKKKSEFCALRLM